MSHSHPPDGPRHRLGEGVLADEAENPCNLLGDEPLWDRR